jgi:hypothetical protein
LKCTDDLITNGYGSKRLTVAEEVRTVQNGLALNIEIGGYGISEIRKRREGMAVHAQIVERCADGSAALRAAI